MVAVAQEAAQVKVGGSVLAPPSLDANLGQDISPTLLSDASSEYEW